jgi:hypothetical protein
MGISKTHRRKTLRIGALLVVFLIAGCAGIEPYKPRDYREEGPEKGLFTGSEGEWVIFRKPDEPKTEGEADKSSDETANGEQQKMGSEKKKKGSKGDE